MVHDYNFRMCVRASCSSQIQFITVVLNHLSAVTTLQFRISIINYKNIVRLMQII